MITSAAILIGKIILMVLLVGSMIIILLGIGHLFHTDDLNTNEDDMLLRHEIEDSEDVVGEKSVFYKFLVKAEKPKERDNDKRPM